MAKNSSDSDKFYDWYDKFVKKYNGLYVPRYWFDKLEESHKELREKLGGLAKSFFIELENQADCPLPSVESDAVAIYQLIPGYFDYYGYNLDVFRSPQLKAGEHVGMQVGKHVIGWMSRNKIEKDIQSEVQVYLGRIGNVWVKNKTAEDKLFVYVSTEPEAFAQIGHYEVDAQSCFRQTAQNQIHKYRLGIFHNSCVILLSKAEIKDIRNFGKIEARFWGIFDFKERVFGVCNGYHPAYTSNVGNLNNAINKAALEILDLKDMKVLGKGYVGINTQHTYLNNDARLVCEPSKSETVHNFRTSMEGLEEQINCPSCGKVAIKEKKPVDNQHVCVSCIEKCVYCEYSKTYTLKPLVDAYDENRKKIKVSSAIAEKMFVKCAKTKELHHINNVSYLNGDQVSNAWLEANDYAKCKYCEYYDERKRFKINPAVFEDHEVCSKCQHITKEDTKNIWEPSEWQLA